MSYATIGHATMLGYLDKLYILGQTMSVAELDVIY